MAKRDYADSSDMGFNPVKSLIAVVKGTVGGYIFLIICFAVLSVIYTYTSFPAGLLEPFVTGITAVSIVLCGIFSAKSISGFGWLHGALSGIIYSLIRCATGAAAINGFGISTGVLSMFAVGLFLGAAGGILGINFSKR